MAVKLVQRKRTGYGGDERQSSSSELPSRLNRQVGQDNGPSRVTFWSTVALYKLSGIACVLIALYWGTQYGGYVLTDADLIFNYHPVLMVLGLIVLYGDALIVYRILGFMPKWMMKITHTVLHTAAIIFSGLGLFAVFENHRRTNKSDFYSLHSWIGIAAFSVFLLQYIGSLVIFYFPGVPAIWRLKVMPYHTFFGIGIFLLAVASAVMGISEKLMLTEGYSKTIPQGIVGNILGVMIFVYAFAILLITTRDTFKRKKLPSTSSSPTKN